MTYDFDVVVDRTITNDMKWHAEGIKRYMNLKIPEKFIPMWIADMDFKTANSVAAAIKKRAEHEIYGYPFYGKDYFASLIKWNKKRYNWDVDASWISPMSGVLPAVNLAIRTFTNEGDAVIIQQPVYDPFAGMIQKTGRRIANNPLQIVDGEYKMNYEHLEELIKAENAKLMILCSPHNPVGKVWKKEELEKLGDICERYGVLVISDEIHCDIVYIGQKHYPFALGAPKMLQNMIICTSPAKTFNVPGIRNANIIIPNEEIRQKFNQAKESYSQPNYNTFSLEVVPAAYSDDGEEWLEQLLVYLEGNVDFTMDFLKQRMPKVKTIRPTGTFLMWLDFSEYGYTDTELQTILCEKAGVVCVQGSWFGAGGEGYIRFNIASPRSIVKDALEKIEVVLNN